MWDDEHLVLLHKTFLLFGNMSSNYYMPEMDRIPYAIWFDKAVFKVQ
jgi:hypothetical protein